jgi:Niemann-Pick C1 protein
LFGGKGYVDPESEGGLEQDLRSRQYPALLGDNEEYDSDD